MYDISWIRARIATHVPGISFDVSVPPTPDLGDFATNIAFPLAKEQKKSPMEVAEHIASALRADPELSVACESITASAPGFINITLRASALHASLRALASAQRPGATKEGRGKTIIVEYSSPNIAKPMHVGHVRSTVIGDALANIHDFLGYRVIRWNYLGDWGTQFGKLIAAYKRWGNPHDVRKDPIATLVRLYVRFHEELKTDASLEAVGQEEFRKLESGDGENKKLWQWFKKESLRAFEHTYTQLGIRFSIMTGESDLQKDMPALVAFLEAQGIAKESEGALIVDLSAQNLPPALIRKSDGASLYLTRELVGLQKRLDHHNPTAMLYVVGNEQSLHFQQLFAVAEILGLRTADLMHVKYGLVLNAQGQKLSTREGNATPLTEVLAEAIQRADAVVQKKNPRLSEKERARVARAVGIGAIKYNDLRELRTSDIRFDWDRMLDFSGSSGPYIQYTYARLMSIARKAGAWARLSRLLVRPQLELLSEPCEERLMRHLLHFTDVVRQSAASRTTNGLALYIAELANEANRFYEQVRILEDAQTQRRNARLLLIETVAKVLKTGLGLLGIQAPEQI